MVGPNDWTTKSGKQGVCQPDVDMVIILRVCRARDHHARLLEGESTVDVIRGQRKRPDLRRTENLRLLLYDTYAKSHNQKN